MQRQELIDEFVGEFTTLKVGDDFVKALDPAPVFNLCLQASNDDTKVYTIQDQAVGEIDEQDKLNDVFPSCFVKIEININILWRPSVGPEGGELEPDCLFIWNLVVVRPLSNHIEMFEVFWFRFLIRVVVIIAAYFGDLDRR